MPAPLLAMDSTVVTTLLRSSCDTTASGISVSVTTKDGPACSRATSKSVTRVSMRELMRSRGLPPSSAASSTLEKGGGVNQVDAFIGTCASDCALVRLCFGARLAGWVVGGIVERTDSGKDGRILRGWDRKRRVGGKTRVKLRWSGRKDGADGKMEGRKGMTEGEKDR